MHTQAQVLATSLQKGYRRTKLIIATEKFSSEEGFKRLQLSSLERTQVRTDTIKSMSNNICFKEGPRIVSSSLFPYTEENEDVIF